MNLENAILIGTGALTWDGSERRSDRYGTITLSNTNSSDQAIAENSHLKENVINTLVGCKGKLIAQIVESRKSTHIGDLHRKIFPSMPNEGEEIILGEGTLFSHDYSWAKAIGLKPEDGRGEDWLNPQSLYRSHEQTVNLYFIPL